MEMDNIKGFFDLIRREGRYALTEPEAKKILAMAGLPITKEAVARDADEAVKVAQKIGHPVAMKIVSPQILHKSDSGAIKINVGSTATKEAYFEVVENARKFNPSAEIHGVLIQEMLFSGIETILGVTTDDQFGPVIMFGLGVSLWKFWRMSHPESYRSIRKMRWRCSKKLEARKSLMVTEMFRESTKRA